MNFIPHFEKFLATLGTINLFIMGFLTLLLEINLIEIVFFFIQAIVIVSLMLFLKTNGYKDQSEPLQTNTSSPFAMSNLLTFEKEHEQKRHYQIAVALLEIGEKEKALSYIDTLINETA